MRAALIQRQIKLNADVLSGLHEEYAKLRAERKKFNEKADAFERYANNAANKEEQQEAIGEVGVYREQASLFTPYIKKFAKKIAGLQEVQKALKHELAYQQSIEAWQGDESYEWNFVAPKFNMPMYEMHGYVGPDGFVVWDE